MRSLPLSSFFSSHGHEDRESSQLFLLFLTRLATAKIVKAMAAALGPIVVALERNRKWSVSASGSRRNERVREISTTTLVFQVKQLLKLADPRVCT